MKNKFVPVELSFSNDSKTISRLLRPSQKFEDDEVSLRLNNEADLLGSTRLEANQDKFVRTESGFSDQRGTSRDFSLFNRRTLFKDNRKTLYSNLRYYDIEGTGPSSVVTLDEYLDIEHNDYLETSYKYNFSDRTSSGIKTRDNKVSASLTHRLYESLVSSFSPYYFKSDSSVLSQDIYSLSLDEDYTKKLGKVGRLNLGWGVTYSEEKRKVPEGIISVVDESHTLVTGTQTFLGKPGINTSTITVTDSTGTITYVLNTDYRVASSGEGIQIMRIPAGAISDGQEVLVDYQAKSNPSLKFNTLAQAFRSRMDFLGGLIGIYYRLNKERHPDKPSEESVILPELEDRVAGIEFKYKNLNIGLEDEYYDSSLSPFKQQRLKESYFFNPGAKSTLTFQSSQAIVRLLDASSRQKFFDFLTRYSAGLNRYSRFNIETGLRWQSGGGIDLDEWGISSGYELDIGNFSAGLDYNFKRQIYIGDRLVNHFFTLKLKREF